ncbi:MAG: flagellar export chaperone FliS [Halopseudomonas sp.]
MTYSKKALNQYKAVGVDAAVHEASPHQLIIMLFDGALTAIVRAKGLIGQKDMAGKGEQINKASRILVHLKGSLDLEKGGEVAANLDPLYDYMIQRLAIANSELDVVALDEVSKLLGEVKAGWLEIPDEHKK